MRRYIFAAVLASMAFASSGATVERVFARQMWPWQTHFEVSYVLRTSPAEAVDVSLKVSAGGDEYTIPASELLGETAGLTAGEYKLVWDSTVSSVPTAAWLKANSGQLAFSVVTAPSASASASGKARKHSEAPYSGKCNRTPFPIPPTGRRTGFDRGASEASLPSAEG